MEHAQEKGSAKESARKVDARDHTLARGDGQTVLHQGGGKPSARQLEEDRQQQQSTSSSSDKTGGSIESHEVKEDLHQSVRKR